VKKQESFTNEEDDPPLDDVLVSPMLSDTIPPFSSLNATDKKSTSTWLNDLIPVEYGIGVVSLTYDSLASNVVTGTRLADKSLELTSEISVLKLSSTHHQFLHSPLHQTKQTLTKHRDGLNTMTKRFF
jgi:hypothetical protein